VLRLDDLDAVELAHWHALADGGICDRCTGRDDPAHASNWRGNRRMSARLLVHCLTADLPGVRRIVVRGVRVVGQLDLCDVKDMRPLVMENCRLDGIELAEASVAGSLSITDSYVAGRIDLLGASIAGYVDLSGTRVKGKQGVALLGDRMQVGDAMYLRAGFRADGTVRLLGASIAGQLDASGAWFSGEPLALNLTSARIGGELLLTRLKPLAPGNGFAADGEIRLNGARVEGVIECAGRLTAGSTGVALRANGIEGKSNFALRKLSRIEGNVLIVGSRIGRDLVIEPAELGVIDVTQTTVGGVLVFAPAAPPAGVNLRDTKVARLEDRIDVWPAERDLNGLHYDSIGPAHDEKPAAVKERRAWLKAGGYVPQPYEQLAAVYRSEGDEVEARAVALAKQGRRTRAMPRWRRPGRALLWATIGYGYRPGQALIWVALLLAAGHFVFTDMHDNQSLKPRYDSTSSTPQPEFASWLYTLDLLLPIVSLKQRDAWIAVTQGAQLTSTLFIIAGWALATAVAAALTGLIKKD
jgi:hypothetical protein